MTLSSLLGALPGAMSQGLIWGIMAIGVFITFKVLDIADLTVDGTLCTGSAVCVVLIIGGYPMWLAILLATLAGMAAGLCTGLFHTLFGIPAILAGILTQFALWSVNLRILGGANQAISADKYDLLTSLRYLGNSNIPFWKNPLVMISVFLVVVIALLYWFFGTEMGCSLRATGANQNMARAQGINTDFCKVLGLMVSNGLVGLSGALLSQYQGFADINMGRGSIVIGLAAVVIGEVLFGKIFRNFALRLLSVAFGSIIYYVVIQVLLWTRLIDSNDLKLLSAIVVALFLALPYWKGKFFSKPVKRGDAKHA